MTVRNPEVGVFVSASERTGHDVIDRIGRPRRRAAPNHPAVEVALDDALPFSTWIIGRGGRI
jgi:hypothetical protein